MGPAVNWLDIVHGQGKLVSDHILPFSGAPWRAKHFFLFTTCCNRSVLEWRINIDFRIISRYRYWASNRRSARIYRMSQSAYLLLRVQKIRLYIVKDVKEIVIILIRCFT